MYTFSLPGIEPQVLVHSVPHYNACAVLTSASKTDVKDTWSFSCFPPYAVLTKLVIEQEDSFIVNIKVCVRLRRDMLHVHTATYRFPLERRTLEKRRRAAAGQPRRRASWWLLCWADSRRNAVAGHRDGFYTENC